VYSPATFLGVPPFLKSLQAMESVHSGLGDLFHGGFVVREDFALKLHGEMDVRYVCEECSSRLGE
jgi:hypothetical protein